MMSEFTQGLILSGIGILITFSALGILILLILALRTLFPAGPTREQGSRSAVDIDLDRERLKETAAAVGVATLLKGRGFGAGSLGSLLEEPVSKWWELNQGKLRGKE